MIWNAIKCAKNNFQVERLELMAERLVNVIECQEANINI